MPKKMVLVCDPISEEALKLLRESEDVQVDYEPNIAPERLLQVVGNYVALIIRSKTKVTREVFSNATRLKVIGRAGVGIDNIDAEAATGSNVKILNTPDALTNAVAEFTIGLMIVLARQISRADESMHLGRWAKSSFQGTELRGKTYGTIGVGRIGQRVAELARALGMQILANDVIPIPKDFLEKYGVEVVSQNEIFERSDFVDLHVPLTQETSHMVNYSKISMMKKTAFLINTSRGKVVDESDLLRALEEGMLAGAALDVFEIEPPVQELLINSKKIVLTPHIAGQTAEAQHEAGTQVVESVLRFLSQK